MASRTRTPEQYRRRNARSKAQRAELIHAAKDKPCVRCGKRYPHYVMDLHHREGGGFAITQGSFARFARSHGLARLREELAKCDVLCANCHREEHHGCVA